MKHKRLNRDSGWGFQYYPYYQIRIDDDIFHGLVCLIKFTDGEKNYWETPKAGRVQVTGSGMSWMQLIPDNTKRVITVMYFPDGKHDEERYNYPKPSNVKFQPSIWYVDVIDGVEFDEYGIATFIDKYLDVIFTPEGDIKIDDRDELDEAFHTGELSKQQYDSALFECDEILKTYCADIRQTDAWCAKIRQLAEEKIAKGELIKACKEVLEQRMRSREKSMNKTGVVQVKESTTDDIKSIQALWADGDVMKYIGFPNGLHETEESIQEWLNRFHTLRPKENHYSIFEDGKYCGETQYRIDEKHRSASLDIKLLEFARGRGIATQAISYAIEEAFNNGAEVVWVDPHPENAKAISLYQRLGFVTKEMPEHVIALGEDPKIYKYMERRKG